MMNAKRSANMSRTQVSNLQVTCTALNYIQTLLLCVDLGCSTMCMLSDSSLHTGIMDYMHCTYLGHVVLYVGLSHSIMCVSSLRKGY